MDRSTIASSLSRSLFGNPANSGMGKCAPKKYVDAAKKLKREKEEKKKIVERLTAEYAGVVVKPLVIRKKLPIAKKVKPIQLKPHLVKEILEYQKTLAKLSNGMNVMLEAIDHYNKK